MEMVFAIVFQIISANTYLQIAPPEQMTINECLEQAREMNFGNSHEYVMVCSPNKEPPRES